MQRNFGNFCCFWSEHVSNPGPQTALNVIFILSEKVVVGDEVCMTFCRFDVWKMDNLWVSCSGLLHTVVLTLHSFGFFWSQSWLVDWLNLQIFSLVHVLYLSFCECLGWYPLLCTSWVQSFKESQWKWALTHFVASDKSVSSINVM